MRFETVPCHAHLHKILMGDAITYTHTICKHVGMETMAMETMAMETVAIDSCVKGHHVYETTWKPTLHEELQCRKDDDNPHDLYAVAVMR